MVRIGVFAVLSYLTTADRPVESVDDLAGSRLIATFGAVALGLLLVVIALYARGGILAPGLVDPHIHIESSMMTACAYAEGALLNGTTTIFCDSHEIGNVCDAAGIEWMLRDARQAPLNIFLTVPSTVPATSALGGSFLISPPRPTRRLKGK